MYQPKLKPQTVSRNLEREAAFHVGKSISAKLGSSARVKYHPSPLSESRYVFINYGSKGVVVRISDHFVDTSRRLGKFYLKTNEFKMFFLFTGPCQLSRNDFYSLPMIDKLVEDTVTYLQGQ